MYLNQDLIDIDRIDRYLLHFVCEIFLLKSHDRPHAAPVVYNHNLFFDVDIWTVAVAESRGSSF